MRVLWKLVFCAAVAMPGVAGADPAQAPANASDASELGLRRLDTAALKQAFIGIHVERDTRGRTYWVEYGHDGSVILSNSSGEIDRGTFSITRQNGGGLCLRLEQQMNQRFCAMWFEAADGVLLFGYSTRDGRLRVVSRPGSE